ncbi:MAG: M48 family metallopeptidase [Burkholderiaceae bacterium]|jgi:Zn-dependent protease with chaperone function|nr:M48 family metallopeptidase [Burkholderiaceae bacterium]
MDTTAAATCLRARWFDGHTSRARPVELTLARTARGPALRVQALDGEREALELAQHQIGWPQRWSVSRPPPCVVVDLRQHGSLEIDDTSGWQAALERAGRRPALAERMQTRWRTLLAVLLLAMGVVWTFYRWGTPWAAAQLTRYVPLAWEQKLSEHALAEIDAHYMKPSRIAPGRQAELRARFDQLAERIGPSLRRYPGYRPPLKLVFRSGMPPNAFALPGGVIVMTDAMVEQVRLLAGAGDAALLGVLAHEIGHVQYRHGTRMVVGQGVLNVGFGLAMGDVSALVSTGASLLTGLAYSRHYEAEADCYAIALLHEAGLPTAPLADLLLSLEQRAARQRQRQEPRASAPAESAPSTGGVGAEWFSTHPDTAARAARMRAGECVER